MTGFGAKAEAVLEVNGFGSFDGSSSYFCSSFTYGTGCLTRLGGTGDLFYLGWTLAGDSLFVGGTLRGFLYED